MINMLQAPHSGSHSRLSVSREIPKEGRGLSPDRPNRNFEGTCALNGQRSGECYPPQRMLTAFSSRGVAAALDGRDICR
jgi:hypothetical protein